MDQLVGACKVPQTVIQTKQGKQSNCCHSNGYDPVYHSLCLHCIAQIREVKLKPEQKCAPAGCCHHKGIYDNQQDDTAQTGCVQVIASEHAITDLLAYSLGLKDTSELSTMVTKLMSGESVDVKSEPLTLDYEDFLNLDLRLILPYELYKYNDKYGVYEDMSSDKDYLKNVYDKAVRLKISGVVYPKNGSMSAMLQPGVGYQSSLIDFIINSAKETEIVQKQLKDEDIDVFSGARFDQESGRFDYAFEDLVSVDAEKLQQAFDIKIDPSAVAAEVQNQMLEISKSITADITPARTRLVELLEKSLAGVVDSIETTEEVNLGTEDYPIPTTRRYIDRADIPELIETYLSSYDISSELAALETDFRLPKEVFRLALKGVLESYLEGYISLYNILTLNFSLENIDLDTLADLDLSNLVKTGDRAAINDTLIRLYSFFFRSSAPIVTLEEQLAIQMTEIKVKLEVMQKIANLTTTIADSFAKSFNIDPTKIASAFNLNFTEDELMRVVSSMFNKTDSNARNNLLKLGYQDRDDPSYISVYFSSFEGKENFIAFINKYNEEMEAAGKKEQVINFSDTTGILMNSVKVIVDAVSYVLIAFVSISLIVSSIMIGVITYISVFERTKEIGILRAIGASKRNISSIFNAETAIIGLLSGLIGISVSYALIPIINAILAHFTDGVDIRAALPVINALSLILLSIILTLIGGLIPAKSAAKHDPVEALRTE